ncbi:MAG: DNA primase [Bacteroidales bacterium]|nr:DNA primase [Bacteroidales bacterium]
MLRYIELDGKVPKHDFKTFSTDHKNYDDAGVILTKDIIVVDFDDDPDKGLYYSKIGELIYNDYPTLKVHTRRGFHLWYKKPNVDHIKTPFRNYTDKLTVSGAKVDYKTGTNSQATIKKGGKLRRMDNEHYLEDINSLPELPLLLHPSKLKHDLYGLDDGDGRNSAMYTHLLSTLEQYQLDDQTLYNLAKFIDENVFAKPLGEKELRNTINSVKSKKPSQLKPKYLDPKDIIMTSEVLVEKLDIHYFRGKVFFKKENHFISDNNLLLRAIDELIKLKPSQHKQLLDLFTIKAHLQDDDDFPIQFNNGYVLYDNEIVEVDPGFTPYYLNVEYDEKAYDKDVDEFLNWFTCDRKDLRLFIEDILGHILMTKGFPHRAFFFWGESGDNGKSTIIKMMQSFVGDLYTSVPLDKFDDDTTVYSLLGKILNVADDINASYLEKSSNFKTIASGDPVMIRPIYSPATTLNSKATLVFTCNEIPVFKDKSGGVKKRIRVIPCDARVKKRDKDIDEKLSTENAKSYLLNLAIIGMNRILKSGDLTECEVVNSITRKYFVESDSVISFLEEHNIDGVIQPAAYRKYVAYCEENGLKSVGNSEFGRRVNNEGYDRKQVRVDGKRRWTYVKN